MRKSNNCCPVLWLVFMVSAAGLFAGGCSGGKSAAIKDEFIKEWRELATKSQGYSPSQTDKQIVMPDHEGSPQSTGGDTLGTETIMKGTDVRFLPTDPVSINLRSADIKTVLLSLSRASGQNILIKDDIKGKISVDLDNVPWDQAFKAILRTQALTFMWEGDIVQVLSIEDMQHDLEVSEMKRQRHDQAEQEKLVEPLLTTVIDINYAEPEDLMVNLNEFITKDEDGDPRGSIRVDKHNNSIVVQAIRDDLRKIIELIKRLDRPTAQIHIKANIVETTKKVARDLGVQWGGLNSTSMGNKDLVVFPGGSTGETGLEAPSVPFGAAGVSGSGFGVNFPVNEAAAKSAGGLGRATS